MSAPETRAEVLAKLLADVERQDFECLGGPLTLCQPWIALKAALATEPPQPVRAHAVALFEHVTSLSVIAAEQPQTSPLRKRLTEIVHALDKVGEALSAQPASAGPEVAALRSRLMVVRKAVEDLAAQARLSFVHASGAKRMQDWFNNEVRHEERIALGKVDAFLASLTTEVAEALTRSAAGRVLAPVEWQPIETAPQTRKIVVFYQNALGKGRTVLACYYREHALEMHDDYAEVGTYDEASGSSYAPAGWYEEHESDEPLMPLEAEPTHWMPLPKPPAALQRAREEGAPKP